MAKYFITLLLVLGLAVENNSAYSRLHAHSQPSSRDARGTGVALHGLMRQRQQHQLQQHQAPLQQQRHERHAHQRARMTRRRATKASEDEESPANDNRNYYARVRRHMEQQREHMEEQERNYHRDHQQQRGRPILGELKSMPRIWQHLADVDYEDIDSEPYAEQHNMFGDGPMSQDDKAEAEHDLNPLERLRNELISDSVEEQNLDDIVPPENPIENEILAEAAEHLDVPNAKAVDNTIANETVTVVEKKPTGGCPKCESNRQVEHITEEELTRLRIEFVKQQILEKLRLKEPPNVSAVGLPKPIYEGVTIEPQEDGSKNKELDDYYARTSKKFIFLKREQTECQRIGTDPSMCFSFKIDDADADGFDVSTAVLWIFKNKQNRSRRINETHLAKQTIVVSEVQQEFDSQHLPVAKTIAIQTVNEDDEWMKIDIEWPIKRWFGNHDLSHLIQISCESCNVDTMDEMISIDKDYRPFIMVDTQNRRRQARSKRSINCSDGVTECCREKLYISFDEIGWGDWIIQPRGYDAYFCRGSCSSVASVAQSSSHHSTFLAKVLSTKRGKKPLELIPCCTAKQYSSLQLVFMDSNNTATQKTFPNMVVESCGCR